MSKYKLQAEKQERGKAVRIYLNEATGTEVKTSHIFTDQEGGRWFGFQDLYKVPMIRSAMARHLTDLYGIGLSLKDIQQWCQAEKTLLKSDDPEKFEKLYSLVLEKERLATFVADPLKQHLALATVYVLQEDERIDYFDETISEEKLKLWKADPDMVAFFLSWHNDHIQRYMKRLEKISTTVSKLQDQTDKLKKGQF